MIAALAADWQLDVDGRHDGATNMAVDLARHDLARRDGVATLRLYGWTRPTLSFGRNERAIGRYDAARLAAAGVDAVRRPTGGRALLHAREVTYCVTAPLNGLPPAAAYRAINGVLRDGLERLGVRVAVAAPRGRSLRPEGAACFAEPSAGELVIGDAKLVGSAQLIEGGALLQHGSILLEDDQARLATLRSPGAGGPLPAPAVATLATALGRAVTFNEVADALAAALDRAVTSVRPAESDAGGSASVAAHRARFTDPGWTWRR